MIFLLGGDGFIGSAFARYCSANGLEHAIVNRANYGEFKGTQCDVLINANGNSKKFVAEEHPLFDFDASVRSVRSSLIDFKTACYVYLSSCDVYPDCSSPSTTSEDQELDVSAQTPYGFHKYLAEQCVRHGAGQWLIVRLGGFTGPGLKKNPIFDILNGDLLRLDPESEMQFIPTDTAAQVVFQLLDRGQREQVFNLCSRGVIKLRDVIEHVGTDVSVAAGSVRRRYEINIEKLSRLVTLPETREVVLSFVDVELRRRRNDL